MKQVLDKQLGMPFAIGIGLLVSIGDRVIFASALGRPLEVGDELNSIVMNAVLVAIPFLVLAFRSSSRIASWAVAFALTVAVNGWWLSKGIAYQLAPDGSGVDMSGALMMLVSPLPISLLVVALDNALRRQAD